jgi:hypothetical protein
MRECYAFGLLIALNEGNGRGGIRTHGGFPHARFRVECLKPDSATLPKGQKKTPKRPTSNIQRRMQTLCEIGCVMRTILSAKMGVGLHWSGVEILSCWQTWFVFLTGQKCYNFRLAMPSPGAAYCMSEGQPTLLLVVH